jgi:hypothetical protein
VVNQPIPQLSSPSPNAVGGKLMACLLVAVDCAVEAQAYAVSKGLDVQFTSEDVRAIANTLFINQNGGR